MWTKLKPRLRMGAFVLLLATCGAQIIAGATAAPATQPVAADEVTAERLATDRNGGPDTRAALPADSGGLVGGNGVVEPRKRETRVAAQVSAVVDRVAVDEAQVVKADAVLVQLADGVERAAMQAAQAEVAAERATLARTLKGLRVEDRDAVAAEAQAAQARAELSRGVLERTEQLAKSGAATPDELERARRQAQADTANEAATRARLRAAEAGGRSEDVQVQRARLEAAEARLAQARAAVERLQVKAPIDGEVLQVKYRAGELYTVGGEPLVVMGDTSVLRVRMDVDERDVARVKPGLAAYVTADAYGARRFPGKVVELGRRFGRKNVRTDDPVEKNDTKILEAVIELEGQPPLVPGQRVTSFIVIGPDKA